MDETNGGAQSSGQGGMGDAQMKAEETMHGLEAYLAPIFEKFPHLPEGGRKFIVDVAPWIALIFGILGILALLSVSGFGILATLLSFGMALPILIHILIGLLSSVFLLMAFPGLKTHSKKGWNLVFYSQVVSIVGGVLGIVTGSMFNIVGMAIGALIGFYILFEVRSYYR